ncbi:MAG: sodium:solute symporter family transporter [Planctomycetaceae bacterium]
MPLSLGWIDLLVLAASLLAVVYIGIRARSSVHDLDSYLLGDRNLPWWAILGSIVATETSTATVLSVPGLAYGETGFRFLQLALGYIIGRAVVVRVLLPLYFRGQLFTAYQVLEQRFGVVMKRAASLLFLVTRNLGDGLRLYLAAIVLRELTGWPLGISLVAMGAVTILYTYFGGMRSVVWNDCLQLAVYMAGGIATVFVLAQALPGGWDELWEFAAAHDKWRLFDFDTRYDRPYTFWAGLIGGAVLTLGTHGTDHMMVQRYLSARSQQDAGRAIFLSGIVVFLQFALFLFIGVQLAAYYSHDPAQTFARTDRVFADFLINHFPRNTGLVGLLLAAILAAAMSTLSSSLNSSANALANDFFLTGTEPPANALAMTRGFTILFGVIQVGVGFAATKLTDAVVSNALTIAGFSAGLLLGVYLLGVLTRRVGQYAALAGAAVGLVTLAFLEFGLPHLESISGLLGMSWRNRPPLAWPWLALVGATTTFACGWLASTLQPAPVNASS